MNPAWAMFIVVVVGMGAGLGLHVAVASYYAGRTTRAVEATNERIDGVVTRVGVHRAELDGIHDDVSGLKERVSSIEGRMQK